MHPGYRLEESGPQWNQSHKPLVTNPG
uniref:Uncharacterized protein n=1 Tax=Anguilla anguilla TaxID=7936 RepID=A0A0E9ULY2_ANGAN